jgi:hypothetical protein
MENDEIKLKFEKSEKIAICIPSEATDEVLGAAKILGEHVIEKGKDVSLLVSASIDDETKKEFDDVNIPVLTNAKPISYVVAVDYGESNIESITYDRNDKENTLYFYITPTNGHFDFKNVEFSTQGNTFDLIITLGVTSFKEIGQVYEENKELFSKTDVISIVKGDDKLGDDVYNIPETTSLIYGVKTFLGEDISEGLSMKILAELVKQEPILEGDPRTESYQEISELTTQGFDLSKALKQKYFSKSYSNLDLQIKLMHNVEVDRANRVIWAKVNHEDLKFCGLDDGDLDLTGRIIFNISKDFDLAFAVYEVNKDKMLIVVESNLPERYSALKIASVFGGKGDVEHAEFTIDNMSLKDFEKNVFMVLNDIYKLDVHGVQAGFRSGSLAVVSDDRTK